MHQKAPIVAIKVTLFVVLAVLGHWLFAWMLLPLGLMAASALGVFLAASVATALVMRIYEHRGFASAGLAWNAASARNLLLGLAGGIAAALFVLVGPLLEEAAVLTKLPGPPGASWPSILFLLLMLLLGGIGEELLFHGYGFQVLLAAMGPFATILPVSVLFGLAHANNLHANTLGLVNTGAWGLVLGYAFWRSGDLWLPIGLHVGWNWMLPLFGANLSGFTMSVTGYTMVWRTTPLWSGGDYGPEGGLVTSIAVVLLFAWLVWKAPVRRQTPYLVRENWD
jgi:hypothetical protein